MIQKSYILGFVNSYLGMAFAAFADLKLTGVAMLLSVVLGLKQFVMNIMKLRAPRKVMPAKFDAHRLRMDDHYKKYPDLYPGHLEKKEHLEAEKQLLMTDMPPLLVGNYNELVIMMGWVLFFSCAFPAGSFFCIFASYFTVIIELEGMGKYKKKNLPQSIRDIGIWLDYVETVSLMGVFVTTYIVIFTSKKLEGVLDGWTYEDLVILVFVVQHLVLLFKLILAEIIEDEPEWVSDDSEKVENRVEQI